jgi:uncharacterized membrane protein YfcA
MELTANQIIQAVIAAFLVGFSKTGMVGLGVLIVPLMASVFPAKASTGALLPMLIFADLFAVAWYRQHAQWRILAKILPWVLPGLVLGTVALQHTSSEALGRVMGGLIVLLIVFQVVRERGGQWLEERLPHTWWFSAFMGTFAGFTTMVGNLAGPIATVYLLSMGLEKREFMGTGAWYYLICNTAKVPFSAALGLITVRSLNFNLEVASIIIVGAAVGILTFRLIPQKWFNRVVLLLAALAALRMLFGPH